MNVIYLGKTIFLLVDAKSHLKSCLYFTLEISNSTDFNNPWNIQKIPASNSTGQVGTKSVALAASQVENELCTTSKSCPQWIVQVAGLQIIWDIFGQFESFWKVPQHPSFVEKFPSLPAPYIPPTLKLNAGKVGSPGWIVEVGASRCNSLPSSPPPQKSHRISNFLEGPSWKCRPNLAKLSVFFVVGANTQYFTEKMQYGHFSENRMLSLTLETNGMAWLTTYGWE